jgi:sugar phosphate isomerase/epimerase
MNPTAPSADRIYISSSALRAKTVAAALRECDELGIHCLELTSSFDAPGDMAEEAIIARRAGLSLLIHNYFPPPRRPFVINLASADAGIRDRSVEHCRGAMDLCSRVGAPFYSVHAGFVTDPMPDALGAAFPHQARRSLAEAADVFYASVSRLCEDAERLGVGLLIENNVLSRKNAVDGRNRSLLGVTADDFDALFAAVPCARLGTLLDVGHLKVSARTLGFDREETLARLRPHVKAVHVSDNDGEADTNEPFDRGAWFLPHVAGFDDALFIIETRPQDPRVLRECVSLVGDGRWEASSSRT